MSLQTFIAPSQDNSKDLTAQKAVIQAMSAQAQHLYAINQVRINLNWTLGQILAWGQNLQQAQVTSADLICNDLDGLTETKWQALYHAIQQAQVSSLDLGCNFLGHITEAPWQAFCNALQHSQVTSLDLSHNCLCDLTEAK